MPFVPHRGSNFTPPRGALPEPTPEPTFGETWNAAWHLENDVMNVLDMMSRPQFEPEEDFDIASALKDYDVKNRTGFFDEWRDEFIGIRSQAEMLHKIGRINEQLKQREVIARAGLTGFVASVASGLASPTIFIPFVGQGRGLVAVGRGARAAFIASVPTELALQFNQETRSWGETAFALSASTALGGILGGAAGLLRKGEREVYEREILQAAEDFRNSSVGAAQTQAFDDAGGLASGAQRLAKVNDVTGVLTNPVTQTINQTDYKSFRVIMQQLADSGLAMARNVEGIATSIGGTIESRLHHYTGMITRADNAFDDAYAKYIYNGNAPRVGKNVRAALVGQFGKTGKLSVGEFADEVSRAIYNGFEHEIPEVVNAAKAVTKEVYEPILKMAQQMKLYPEDVTVVGDKAYVNRLYNVTAIRANTDEFVSILAKHYEQDLNARFVEELKKFKQTQVNKKTEIEDLQRPIDKVRELEAEFRSRLEELDANLPQEIQMLEEAIANNRATARALKASSEKLSLEDEKIYKQLLSDARAMERQAGEAYAGIKAERAGLRRRLKNLSRAVVAVEEKQAKKLERISRMEEMSLNSLNRLVRKAQTTLQSMKRWDDKKLDQEVSRLKTEFARVGQLYDKAEERMAKLADDEEFHRLGFAEDLQLRRAERLDDLAEKLERAEKLPRVELREAIQEVLNETVQKVQRINASRAMRAQRLREQAAKLDPALVQERINRLKDALAQAPGEFIRKWEGEQYKATSVDLEKGLADFSDVARENAELVKDRIIGSYLRLPYSEVLAERRGAELRRVLHIPSKEIDKFLDKDIRRLTRVYTRTLGPDIELMQKFGTLNGEELLKPAVEEMNQKIAELGRRERPAKISEKKWVKMQEAESEKINADFTKYKNNVLAVIERLRGTRGMPSDPDGFAYRAARVIMNLNVLRMMGMVTVSSFNDVARPIMRYGLLRTFRDGFVPFITQMKQMKLSMEEAKLAGIGTNISAHQRSMAYRDIMDEYHRGSKIEKAIEWTSNRMGMVALFDYWTQAGELIASAVANGKLMDSIATVVAKDGSMSEKAATAFLAQNGITGDIAERIWKEVQKGGGGKVDGAWWPNTESWTDQVALRAYRAALAREALITIPRPDASRALLSDVNMLGRMLYQFKSFGMSSMSKIVMAGLQQRDAAVLSGVLASLALGALSYYTWAVITGGKAYQEMMNADFDKWADEMISRSGLMGNFAEVQRIGQTIPLVAPLVSFSGRRQTRRPGDDLGEALLGPSFDFLEKTADVITGLDEPNQQMVRSMRRLTPFQNTIILREVLDAVEAAAATQLPERKGQ